MQRDIGNEVIVALVAVGALAFAFAFGIVVSLSLQAEPLVVPTVIAAAETAAPATLPPTSSKAQPVTRVAQPLIVPTQTPTLTATPTATLVPTDTAIPPSATLSPSMTPTPRPVCVVPFGWLTYRVGVRDTLAGIAAQTGVPVDELAAANCAVTDLIPGTLIYVPRLPTGDDNRSAPVPEGCSDLHVQIVSPVSGQQLRGAFRLFGTADGDGFQRFVVEVRPEGGAAYMIYRESDMPVTGGLLAEVNPADYGSGLHWVRLRVLTMPPFAQRVPCAIPLFFD